VSVNSENDVLNMTTHKFKSWTSKAWDRGHSFSRTYRWILWSVNASTTLQVGGVLLATCQWTPNATQSFTVTYTGTVQVTSVCLVVDRWLFSPTLDVRQTAANWLTG